MRVHQKWECWARKRLPSLLWMRMWKGHRQWSHISTSPVTLNTPLDECLSLAFHVSVLHKFTSVESGGLAVLFTTCGIRSQRLGKACSAQTGWNRRTTSPDCVSQTGFVSSVVLGMLTPSSAPPSLRVLECLPLLARHRAWRSLIVAHSFESSVSEQGNI